jgi:hypothetical protein
LGPSFIVSPFITSHTDYWGIQIFDGTRCRAGE